MERSARKTDKLVLHLTRLPAREALAFELRPEKDHRDGLAAELDLLGLTKVSFSGQITPEGRSDWRLSGNLGATVVQPCSVTLSPVTTRIEEAVNRLYTHDVPEPQPGEVEMPEDDTVEHLPDTLDLREVMAEALALALPLFPRSPDAVLEDAQFTEPGKTPLTDDDLRPFAGLKALKDKLEGDE